MTLSISSPPTKSLSTKTPLILMPESAYVFNYPIFNEYADQQLQVFWPHNEIKVSKDKGDLLKGLSESEYHAVVTTLKLFTKYELFVGDEYWGGRVAKTFQRPEIRRMASCFANVELNSHAPFYDKINKELGISSKEFYDSYANDPILVDRMSFIGSLVNCEDILVSLAGFSMIEGAVLYSSFAFLKHFQVNGKNKIANIVSGIDMSVRDENLHAQAGAELFRVLKSESNLTPEYETWLQELVISLAHQVCEHEERISEMLFEKGSISNITVDQLKAFIKTRINLCVNHLGYASIYAVEDNPIGTWFYKGINNYLMNDFFQKVGREYTRGWEARGFTWNTEN